MGITTEGEKLALGLWDGSTENATVAGALLSDLVDRGLDVEQGLLFVIDGSKALRKAIRQVFGNDVPVQRCVQHKERNVLDHLPERDRDPVKLRLRHAWQETDHDVALEQLTALALELDHTHPGAAASLREGMEETLTVTRLGITGKLKLTLQIDQPDRVDDLHRPGHQPQRQELELAARCACGGPPPGCSKPRPASAKSGLPRPRQPRRRHRARPHPPHDAARKELTTTLTV